LELRDWNEWKPEKVLEGAETRESEIKSGTDRA
jgi:hypothetical protein